MLPFLCETMFIRSLIIVVVAVVVEFVFRSFVCFSVSTPSFFFVRDVSRLSLSLSLNGFWTIVITVGFTGCY